MLETKILFVGEGRQPAQAWWAAAQMGSPPVGARGGGGGAASSLEPGESMET